jgi:hypothetical protein
MRKQKRIEDAARNAAHQLLALLCEEGARGAVSEFDDDKIVIFAPRQGVTIARGSLPLSVANVAVSEGLAFWEKEARGKRVLRVTDAGRSRHARDSAPAEAPPFLAQHAQLASRVVDEGAARVLINEGESPLAWLARRKDKAGRPYLTPPQLEAGERFRRDIEQAQILQRVTANWEAQVSSTRRGDGGANVCEAAMDARRRMRKALGAVGSDLAGLLMDVCGYLKGLESVESERGWPARSGKIVLRIALDRLAGHYGLGEEARGLASAALAHWGAEDFRPSIE